MRRFFLLLICLTSLNFIAIAQTARPAILRFMTSAEFVGYDALQAQSARIPVEWEVANRPIMSNLYFEQILPDGQAVNVELPRQIPWVASQGIGNTAPILPTGAEEIVLQVTLKHLLNGRVYDTKEIRVRIVPGLAGADHTAIQPSPTILYFNVLNNNQPLNATDLDSGSLRLSVNWSVMNRPDNANLYFEQILPDGRAVNVELPRTVEWVNSSGEGVIAPVASSNTTEIVLRLRLYDRVTRRDLDQMIVSVPVQRYTGGVQIPYFSATVNSLARSQVGQMPLEIAWEVVNRPPNSNLVFEQILPNGQIRNAEFPRDVLLIPSQGYGTLNAILPSGNISELVFQLRIADVSTNSTYTSRELRIALTDTDTSQIFIHDFTVSPETINGHQPPSLNITWNVSNAVRLSIGVGDYLRYENRPMTGSLQVPADEYSLTSNSLVISLNVVANNGNSETHYRYVTVNGNASITNFSLNTRQIATGQSVTAQWRIAGDYRRAYLAWAGSAYPRNPIIAVAQDLTSAEGTMTLPVSLVSGVLPSQIGLFVEDAFGNLRSELIELDVQCPYEWVFPVDIVDCPSSGVVIRQGAYQEFERGFILWNPANPTPMWVFQNNGVLRIYSDSWDGSPYSIVDKPPTGLFAPERGFGYLWNFTPSVRQAVGWARATERSVEIRQQSTGEYPFTVWYITLPDGRLARVRYELGGTLDLAWSLVGS